MRNVKVINTVLIVTALLTLTACNSESGTNRQVIKEPGKTITVIDNENVGTDQSEDLVEKIEHYEGIAISDWQDEETVVISKENTDMDKMSLAELSEDYPKSLYLYNLNTREAKLLYGVENTFLVDAKLSPDKKNLLYYQGGLGDGTYAVLDMNTLNEFSIMGDASGVAYTAHWADNENVMGASYNGGVYVADIRGNLSIVDELRGEAVSNVIKMQDHIMYTTNTGPNLYLMNLVNKQIKDLGEKRVYRMKLSPDQEQVLLFKEKGPELMELVIADAEGNDLKTIAQGAYNGDAAWSPDQSKIAYNIKSADNSNTNDELYIYDLQTGKSTQIAVNLPISSISWSPSGQQIALSDTSGSEPKSSIIHLK